MCKECLMCILCPCSLFFGPDCRKNLQRESRFCLRLSSHSSGIVRGTYASLPPEPASPPPQNSSHLGMGKFQGVGYLSKTSSHQ